MSKGINIGLDVLVRATPERNSGVTWSLALHQRVDELVDGANAAGESTSRKEVVGAILADFEFDAATLAALLKRYRTMLVGDLLRRSGPADSNVVAISPNRPGPRKRVVS